MIHERDTFIGEFSRIENVGHFKKNQKYSIVLKNIRLEHDNSFFCSYARFKLGKGFKQLGNLLPGVKIKFNARYIEYKPGHFKISHPTKISFVNLSQQGRVYKEVCNYDLTETKLRKSDKTTSVSRYQTTYKSRGK